MREQHSNCAATVQQPGYIARKVEKGITEQMSLFAGALQALEISSKVLCCFHTAEVAGSIPASPTRKRPANNSKNKTKSGLLTPAFSNACSAASRPATLGSWCR